MALANEKRANIDDSQYLITFIEAAQNIQQHTDYVVRISRGWSTENFWTVHKRYNDFSNLHAALQISGMELHLPPKKVFGNMDREFICERQQKLQQYLNTITSNHMLQLSIHTRRFLDPENYSTNFQEKALAYVSMFFRSEPNWELLEIALDLGWRIRKQYFLIRPKDDIKAKQLLAWNDIGVDCSISVEKDLNVIIKLLTTIQHPYILPTLFTMSNEIGAVSVRNFQTNGSLRDLVCKVKPRGQFLKKYCCPKAKFVPDSTQIATFGRQILEALKFIYDKGLFYGHLHTGNVFIEDGVCLLSDVENGLLGLPAYYRPMFVHLKRIQTMEQIDVYSLGHVLYELSAGEPLQTPTVSGSQLDLIVSHPLRDIVKSLLSKDEIRSGLPSISDLIENPFFSSVSLSDVKRYLKIPSKLKLVIRTARDAIEQKLKDEQKLMSHQQKLQKAHAFHNSEEEKQRRKKSSRKKLQLQQQGIPEEGSDDTSSKTSSRPSSPSLQQGRPNSRPQSPNLQRVVTPPVPPTPPPPPGPGIPAPPPPPFPGTGHSTPAPPPPPPTSTSSGPTTHRSALLSSISGFNKTKLKKSTNVDKNTPGT